MYSQRNSFFQLQALFLMSAAGRPNDLLGRRRSDKIDFLTPGRLAAENRAHVILLFSVIGTRTVSFGHKL